MTLANNMLLRFGYFPMSMSMTDQDNKEGHSQNVRSLLIFKSLEMNAKDGKLSYEEARKPLPIIFETPYFCILDMEKRT
jgi:hypothetical protein